MPTGAGIYTDEQKIEKYVLVAQVLSDLPNELKSMATEMAHSMSDVEIVMRFNQMITSLFTLIINKTKPLPNYKEFNFEIYFKLLEKSISINTSFPIERFCLIMLIFAPQIYEKNENFFMNYNLNAHIKVSQNEFSIFESQKFKDLWHTLDVDAKNKFIDDFTLLTIFAHTYFLQRVAKKLA